MKKTEERPGMEQERMQWLDAEWPCFGRQGKIHGRGRSPGSSRLGGVYGELDIVD